jgi:hypothetical protein
MEHIHAFSPLKYYCRVGVSTKKPHNSWIKSKPNFF